MAGTFRFGQMEAALAAVFGVAPAKMLAFHGRLQFLQVRGLPLGVRAGRGVKIDYGRDQAMQFLIAMVLEQHGVDPKTAVWLIERWWKEIGRWMHKATDTEALAGTNPNPVFMTIELKLLAEMFDAPLRGAAGQVSRIGYFRRFNLDMKVDAEGRLSRHEGTPIRREEVAIVLDRMEEAEPPFTGRAPWVTIVNLTKLVRAFDLAIEEAKQEQNEPTASSGAKRQTLARRTGRRKGVPRKGK